MSRYISRKPKNIEVSATKQELIDLIRAQNDLGFKTSILMDLLYSMPTAYIDMIVEEFYFTQIYKGTYYRVRNRLSGEVCYFKSKSELAAYQKANGAKNARYTYYKHGVFEVHKFN